MEERRKRVRKVKRKRRKKTVDSPPQQVPNSLPTLSSQMPEVVAEPEASQAIILPEVALPSAAIFPTHLFQPAEMMPFPVPPPPPLAPPMPHIGGISDLLASMSHLAGQMGQNGGSASASVSMRWENGQMVGTDMKVNCGGTEPPQPTIKPPTLSGIMLSGDKKKPKKNNNEDLWVFGLGGVAAGILVYSLMNDHKRSKSPKKPNSI